MSKQIKPGMLCIVRGATQTLPLNGMIVTIEKKSVPNTEYQSSCGVKVTVWPEDNWDCSGGEYLPWTHQNGQTYCFITRPILSSLLIPISDPDIELTTEDVKGLENV